MCEEGEEDDESSTSSYKKNWVGLYGSLDLPYVTGDDVCGQDSQSNDGYACFITNDNEFEPEGTQYHGNPIPSGEGNAIDGGFALSTIRAMVSYDRAISENIMLGVRLGYALRGGPQPDGGPAFFPFHAEARAAYWFGNKPFGKVGVRPFAFASGGMAQVDSKVELSVQEQDNCPATGCTVVNGSELIQRNPQRQTLEAWRKAGQGFIALGGGVMYAFSSNQGIVGELKISYMLPTPNIVISPTLGWAIGF